MQEVALWWRVWTLFLISRTHWPCRSGIIFVIWYQSLGFQGFHLWPFHAAHTARMVGWGRGVFYISAIAIASFKCHLGVGFFMGPFFFHCRVSFWFRLLLKRTMIGLTIIPILITLHFIFFLLVEKSWILGGRKTIESLWSKGDSNCILQLCLFLFTWSLSCGWSFTNSFCYYWHCLFLVGFSSLIWPHINLLSQ